MPSTCPYCTGPVRGRGLTGRPWPGRPQPLVYCCYGCLSLGERRQQAGPVTADATPRRFDWVGVRLGLAAVIAAQSMVFGLAINVHDDVPSSVRSAVHAAILAGTLAVIGLLGVPLARTAVRELRAGRLTIEALFLVTIGGALGASVQSHLAGVGSIYYEVVSILLVVYTLGKVVGASGRAAALASTHSWADRLATCRRIVPDSDLSRPTPVSEVAVGDVVEVYPGESIPVDGVVRRGTGFVSEAAISGEPFPIVRRPGDRVTAGSVSHDATFRVEATTAGTDRRVDALLAAVDAARDTPLSLQSSADRVGAAFLPAVVLVAIGTFVGWATLSEAGWDTAWFNAMAVLLVACPCVIGLATPIVVWTVVGRLAECGLVVRSGDAVERLAGVDRVLADKTGTLTEDSFALVDLVTADGVARDELVGWLAVVQSQSSHPVARAFATLARIFPAGAEPRVIELRTIPGAGIEAVIDAGGYRLIRVGKPEWITLQGGTQAAELRRLERQLSGPIAHQIAVEVDGKLAALAAVAERVRASTPDALAEFWRLGLPVEILTGDAVGRAESLGLPVASAGLRPEDKHRRVRELVDAGRRPLVIGDGINDAAALAAGHVGVALAGGTDLAVGAAGVTLYHGDLRAVPWAIQLSREAVRVARRNMLFAASYNVVGMALAAAGLLHPIAAALLMVASSLTLVFASVRVGANPRHCDIPVSADEVDDTSATTVHRPGLRTAIHGLAFALQAPVFAALAGLSLLPTVALSAGVASLAIVLAAGWHRRSGLSHTADMAFGMLTVGNLGMLLGWWADNGLAPLTCADCCACATFDPDTLGMWVGMLVFANAAMLGLGRRPLPGGNHTTAMFTGGNVGMIAGMWAGGWASGFAPVAGVPVAAAIHLAGMTVGMVGGMLAGTWVCEVLVDAAAGFVAGGGRFVPRAVRANPR